MKGGLSEDDAKSKAGHYNFWGDLGYSYEDLKSEMLTNIADFKPQVLDSNQYLHDLWECLSSKRHLLCKNISISTGINLGRLQYIESSYFNLNTNTITSRILYSFPIFLITFFVLTSEF
jgi:hypothetical protein